jgi:inhibitor of KinA sporulation pathway (predicted exonuclease)
VWGKEKTRTMSQNELIFGLNCGLFGHASRRTEGFGSYVRTQSVPVQTHPTESHFRLSNQPVRSQVLARQNPTPETQF